FRNILENALAACADPGEIEVSWQPAHLENRPALRVCIHDNGPGLESSQRRRIFEPFYTTKAQGTGLGLAITKRLIEAHGGHIDVNCDGPGAAIIVLFPRDEA